MFLLKTGGTLKISRERGTLTILTQSLSGVLYKPQHEEGGRKNN